MGFNFSIIWSMELSSLSYIYKVLRWLVGFFPQISGKWKQKTQSQPFIQFIFWHLSSMIRNQKVRHYYSRFRFYDTSKHYLSNFHSRFVFWLVHRTSFCDLYFRGSLLSRDFFQRFSNFGCRMPIIFYWPGMTRWPDTNFKPKNTIC